MGGAAVEIDGALEVVEGARLVALAERHVAKAAGRARVARVALEPGLEHLNIRDDHIARRRLTDNSFR